MFADRIGAAINQAFETLGLVASCTGGPVRKAADGPAPFPAIALAPVVQDKGAAAGGGDPDAEAFGVRVVGDPVAVRGRRQRFDDPVREFLSHMSHPVSAWCPQSKRTSMARHVTKCPLLASTDFPYSTGLSWCFLEKLCPQMDL